MSLLTVGYFKILTLELILKEVDLIKLQMNYRQFDCLKNDWHKF